MKVFLDACVLFPPVCREMLLGAARSGLFEPLVSPRVLEEWARAARRVGDEGGARAAIAMLQVQWPKATIHPRAGDVARLVLPDPDDVHVLAAAIAGSADLLVTWNARDFPRHTLGGEGISRADPDGFLHALWREAPAQVANVGARVLAQAQAMETPPETIRAMLKKARLPRLGKALA